MIGGRTGVRAKAPYLKLYLIDDTLSREKWAFDMNYLWSLLPLR